MNEQRIHVIHESYGDAVARRESNKVGYAVLGVIITLFGFFGGIGALLQGDFKIFLFGIFLTLVGVFLVWLWFRNQRYYKNYFRRRNNAPITRISYG